eukprot:Tbor_TRINITY_DN1640_c0_g1::TRINITY_DN1640_c0_g1_i1::g.7575::m.7575
MRNTHNSRRRSNGRNTTTETSCVQEHGDTSTSKEDDILNLDNASSDLMPSIEELLALPSNNSLHVSLDEISSDVLHDVNAQDVVNTVDTASDRNVTFSLKSKVVSFFGGTNGDSDVSAKAMEEPTCNSDIGDIRTLSIKQDNAIKLTTSHKSKHPSKDAANTKTNNNKSSSSADQAVPPLPTSTSKSTNLGSAGRFVFSDEQIASHRMYRHHRTVQDMSWLEYITDTNPDDVEEPSHTRFTMQIVSSGNGQGMSGVLISSNSTEGKGKVHSIIQQCQARQLKREEEEKQAYLKNLHVQNKETPENSGSFFKKVTSFFGGRAVTVPSTPCRGTKESHDELESKTDDPVDTARQLDDVTDTDTYHEMRVNYVNNSVSPSRSQISMDRTERLVFSDDQITRTGSEQNRKRLRLTAAEILVPLSPNGVANNKVPGEVIDTSETQGFYNKRIPNIYTNALLTEFAENPNRASMLIDESSTVTFDSFTTLSQGKLSQNSCDYNHTDDNIDEQMGEYVSVIVRKAIAGAQRKEAQEIARLSQGKKRSRSSGDGAYLDDNEQLSTYGFTTPKALNYLLHSLSKADLITYLEYLKDHYGINTAPSYYSNKRETKMMSQESRNESSSCVEGQAVEIEENSDLWLPYESLTKKDLIVEVVKAESLFQKRVIVF